MLLVVSVLKGHATDASDGRIGTVSDFLLDRSDLEEAVAGPKDVSALEMTPRHCPSLYPR